MHPSEIATSADINSLNKRIDSLNEQISKLFTVIGTPKKETWLTYKQVMAQYNMSKSHLSDLSKEGKIPFTDEYGVRLYPQSLIEKTLHDSMKNNLKNQNKHDRQ